MTVDSNEITEMFNLYSSDVQGISTEVSPSDNMYFDDENHYFSVGQSALRVIKTALIAAELHPNDIATILDFPCGYGRVLRSIRAMFPHASVTGSDILREGVDYCSSTLGANGVYANSDIDKVELSDSFDLIWCGSLLTHLNLARWNQLVKLFSNVLTPNGILVVTVHGQRVIDKFSAGDNYGLDDAQATRILVTVDECGFAYEDYPGQKDYGISISKPSWVLNFLAERFPSLEVVHFKERAWDDHHDVVVCQKRVDV
jgi:SAM-dependent methyltransferase